MSCLFTFVKIVFKFSLELPTDDFIWEGGDEVRFPGTVNTPWSVVVVGLVLAAHAGNDFPFRTNCSFPFDRAPRPNLRALRAEESSWPWGAVVRVD